MLRCNTGAGSTAGGGGGRRAGRGCSSLICSWLRLPWFGGGDFLLFRNNRVFLRVFLGLARFLSILEGLGLDLLLFLWIFGNDTD